MGRYGGRRLCALLRMGGDEECFRLSQLSAIYPRHRGALSAAILISLRFAVSVGGIDYPLAGFGGTFATDYAIGFKSVGNFLYSTTGDTDSVSYLL